MPSSFGAKPWYKPEERGLAWMIDHLLVWTGRREGTPGPQFGSQGYRLQEIVSRIFDWVDSDHHYFQGPLHYEHRKHPSDIYLIPFSKYPVSWPQRSYADC